MLNLLNDPKIPSVGQSVIVEGYVIAVAARCTCTAAGAFVSMTVTCSPAGDAVTAGVCRHCGVGYTVQGMDLDNMARLSFRVAVLSAKPADES